MGNYTVIINGLEHILFSLHKKCPRLTHKTAAFKCVFINQTLKLLRAVKSSTNVCYMSSWGKAFMVALK